MFVIAGATGHVGAGIATELLNKGQKVRVIVRDAAKGAAWKEKGAEVAIGSLEDRAFLAKAFNGAKGAFVLLPPNLATSDMYGWQRQTADSIAAGVKDAGVGHVVFLSSVGADLASGNGPIQGAHYAENVLRGSGTKLTSIRAGYFQENIGNVMGAVKNAGIFPSFLAADYPFPMIATKDISALAAASLLEGASKSENVDLHGPQYSVRQVVEKISAALGKPVKLVDVPEAGWVPAMVEGGMPKHAAECFAEMYGAFARGIVSPKGDRMVHGKTEIDETIRALVG